MTQTRPNDKNASDTRGFTLIEILIAISILAIVLSTIFASYTGTFRIIEETESQADIYGMARIAMERIQEDLESAYASEGTETRDSGQGALLSSRFVGEDKGLQGRSADTLRFLSRAHISLDQGGADCAIAEIVYSVRQNSEGEGFVLYRTDTPEFEDPPENGTGGLVLCEDIFSFNLTYYDMDGEVYDNWDSTKEEFGGGLPVMVSIFLEFLNRTNPEIPLRFVTGVILPMARGKYAKAS